MKLFQTWWFSVAMGALSYLAVTAALLNPKELLKNVPKAPHAAAETAPASGKLWDYRNPELEKLVKELKEEREALARREQELAEFEVRLRTERTELNQVTQVVFQVQREIDQTILRIKEDETANLKKLAKVYAEMTSEGAAAIMREMLNDQLVKILYFMKDSEKAPVLETMAKFGPEEARRVAEITEKLRMSVMDAAAAKPRTP